MAKSLAPVHRDFTQTGPQKQIVSTMCSATSEYLCDTRNLAYFVVRQGGSYSPRKLLTLSLGLPIAIHITIITLGRLLHLS